MVHVALAFSIASLVVSILNLFFALFYIQKIAKLEVPRWEVRDTFLPEELGEHEEAVIKASLEKEPKWGEETPDFKYDGLI